jgi:hypothetical protein
MAIEGFGESLLTQKRQRDQEQAKKLRKREERSALLGLTGAVGAGLYRQALKKKQQDFFNSEPLLAQKAIRTNAASTSSQIINRENEIQGYGFGDRYEYYMPGVVEQLKADMLREDPSQKRAIDLGAHDVRFEKDATALAKAYLARHDESLRAARLYQAAPSFDTELSVSNKRAESPFEDFINMVRPGRSRQELEQETIEAYKGQTGAMRAEQVLALEEAYRSTRDLVTAFNYANADLSLTEEELKPFIITRTERKDFPKKVGDQVIQGYHTVKVTENTITQETTRGEEIFKPYLTQEEIEKNKDHVGLKELNKLSNIHRLAESVLADKSKIQFQTKARSLLLADGVSEAQINRELIEPSTLRNYELLANAYNSFAFTEEDYQADIDDRVIDATTRIIAQSPMLMNRISGLLGEFDTKVNQAGATGIDKDWLENWQLRMDVTTSSVRNAARQSSVAPTTP